MKTFLTILVLVASTVSSIAQSFNYSDSLKIEVNGSERNDLQQIIEQNLLFNGNLNFIVNEGDMKPFDKSEKPIFTIKESISKYNEDLKAASTIDSADNYMQLSKLYEQSNNSEDAMKMMQMAFNILQRLLAVENPSSEVLRLAGMFTMQSNPDQSAAFRFFNQAYYTDKNDSASLQFMITIYNNYGLLHESDSLLQIAFTEFPEMFAPYLFKTNNLAINMYLDYLEKPEIFTTKCLDEIADVQYLTTLRTENKSQKNVVLSYLMSEMLLLMKYQSNIAGDTFVEIIPCDKLLLDEMKIAFKKYHSQSDLFPQYTTSNAIGWTFAIEQKYDSSLFYLNRAFTEIKPLGIGYNSSRRDISNAIMAIKYLSKDSIGSIATMKSIIAAHDTIGYSNNDYLMLSVLNLRTGNNMGASDAIKNLVALKNPPTASLRIKSYLYWTDKNNTEAIAWSDKAIEAEKQEISNYIFRGVLHLMNNEPKKALQFLEAAWYIDKTDSELNQILERYFVAK